MVVVTALVNSISLCSLRVCRHTILALAETIWGKLIPDQLSVLALPRSLACFVLTAVCVCRRLDTKHIEKETFWSTCVSMLLQTDRLGSEHLSRVPVFSLVLLLS